MSRTRIAICGMAALLLAGCTTLPRQDARFSLAKIDASAAPVRIVDHTSANRSAGTSNGRLLNAALEPPLAPLLARRLSAANPEMINGRVVNVHVADVEAFVIGSSLPKPPIYYAVGAPIAASVIGNLLGRGIVSLFAPGDKLSIITTLEVSVDGVKYRAQGGSEGLPNTAESLAANAVDNAIQNLILRLKPQPIMVDNTPITVPPGAPPE